MSLNGLPFICDGAILYQVNRCNVAILTVTYHVHRFVKVHHTGFQKNTCVTPSLSVWPSYVSRHNTPARNRQENTSIYFVTPFSSIGLSFFGQFLMFHNVVFKFRFYRLGVRVLSIVFPALADPLPLLQAAVGRHVNFCSYGVEIH